VDIERVEGVLSSDDGVSLATTTWCRLDIDPATAVVLVHGLGIDRNHRSVVETATALLRAGFAVLAFDGRGHGASGGVCTLGTDEVGDVAAAVTLATQLAPTVVAVGSSMGGIAVLRYASIGARGSGRCPDDIAGVVSVSAPATWRIHSARSLAAAALTRTSVGRRALLRRSGVRISPTWASPPEPADVAAAVTCATAIVHGAGDRFIPADEARRLFDRLAGPRRLDVVEGMAHGFGPLAEEPIVEAVRWILETAAVASPAAATTTPDRPDQGRCERSSPH
jgi:alpha-beta hydrolase superfamily lysophospholipase